MNKSLLPQTRQCKTSAFDSGSCPNSSLLSVCSAFIQLAFEVRDCKPACNQKRSVCPVTRLPLERRDLSSLHSLEGQFLDQRSVVSFRRSIASSLARTHRHTGITARQSRNQTRKLRRSRMFIATASQTTPSSVGAQLKADIHCAPTEL